MLIPKSLAPKAEDLEHSGHLAEKENSQTVQESSTTEEQETVPQNVDEEFDDMPALEEPDLTLESGPAHASEDQQIESESTSRTQVERESEIIELNAPSDEHSSIFGKQKVAKKSGDIFADLVSDSDASDDEKEEENSNNSNSAEPFIIEQSNSSHGIQEVSPVTQSGSKLLIEEVQSSDPKKRTSSPAAKIETLSAPSEPKKNPFLITEVHSSDLSDMFSRQDDLLHDDVEQMYVGDAHEEALRVQPPGNDDFLSRMGQTINHSSKNQSKCVHFHKLKIS